MNPFAGNSTHGLYYRGPSNCFAFNSNAQVFAFGASSSWIPRLRELHLDLKFQAGAIDQPLDQAIAHGGAGSPDAAGNVLSVAQQADRAFADHFRRRSVAGIAIALHGDPDLTAIRSEADEQ